QVQLPQSLPQMKQQELRIFTSLSGEQFDKLFVSHMQADHAKDLIKYRTVSQTAQNEQVRQYASRQLPALSQHFESVQQCAVALGLPSGSLEAIPAAGRIEGTGSGRSGEQPQPNR
ncbi:MAG TPA: DUF4142 domain-containing protein, partial [Tepidisphaeraceae bacterium]|nr:DUF4142 domain-containing protein [Tepidisphaeraceae bacterium]